MQKQIIYFKDQAGMALIYTLFAVLLMSLISVALLKSQNEATKSYNILISDEIADDSGDFCVQAAFDLLKQRSMNGTLNTNQNSVESFSPYTMVNNAYNNSSTRPQYSRISNRTLAYQYMSCSLRYIKDGTSSSGGTTGTISKSRSYGSSVASTVKYYRLLSIKDDGSERIEFETILSI